MEYRHGLTAIHVKNEKNHVHLACLVGSLYSAKFARLLQTVRSVVYFVFLNCLPEVRVLVGSSSVPAFSLSFDDFETKFLPVQNKKMKLPN